MFITPTKEENELGGGGGRIKTLVIVAHHEVGYYI